MQHLTPHQDEYRYRNRPTGDVTQVTVSHEQAGTSWMTGDHHRAGIKLFINPLEDVSANRYSTMFGHGIAFGLVGLPRRNAKQLAIVASLIDPVVPRIAELWELGQSAPDCDHFHGSPTANAEIRQLLSAALTK